MSRLLSTPLARILLVVLLAAAVVLVFRDSFASMFHLWSLSSYQHAYIVPPMSLLLLWMARREFATQPLTGSAVGLVLLAVLAVLWLGARASAVQAVELRLRDDVVTEPNNREANQASAPALENGLFLVPKVIE